MARFAYLITDGHYGMDTPEQFAERLGGILEKHHPEYALYRDKTNPDYRLYAKAFLSVCKCSSFLKCLLHGDVELAVQLGAHGVHLTSAQIDETTMAKQAGLLTIVSTHTLEEVLRVQEYGADAVTYSPVFYSPGKGEPKGVADLKSLVETVRIPVIGLGGVVKNAQVEAIARSGAAGFAAIRYFS